MTAQEAVPACLSAAALTQVAMLKGPSEFFDGPNAPSSRASGKPYTLMPPAYSQRRREYLGHAAAGTFQVELELQT
jgi:hypothetical protein